MKKVFLLAALVLACTAGSNASAMNEAALNASMSEMMPVKKTTKKTTKKTSKKTTKKTSTKTTKKTSTKKTSTKKTTSAASNTTAATTTTATTTAATTAATTSNTATSTSTTSNAGSAVAGILGAVLGGNSNSSSAGSSIINGILNNVIGSGTFSKQDLCAHTWKYSKPGCAFTSENLLAKAGGEIAANKVEEKLGEYYSKFGFSGSNTYFTFKTDGTFAAKIDGKSWQGNYTFDEKTHAIQMKGLLLSMSGYATKTTNGISLLFDQTKLLNLIKTMGALKGSSTLSAIGTIANNYDGMRVGFEMSK